MTHLFCPYLNDQVELSEDREWHILERHPELAPLLRQWIAATLEDPDGIRRSARLNNAWLFSRWHPGLLAGKHMVVVVVTKAFKNIQRLVFILLLPAWIIHNPTLTEE